MTKDEIRAKIQTIDWIDYISPFIGFVRIDERLLGKTRTMADTQVIAAAAMECADKIRAMQPPEGEVESMLIQPIKVTYYVLVFEEEVYASATPFVLPP